MNILPALAAIICSRKNTRSRSYYPPLSSGLGSIEERAARILTEAGATYDESRMMWMKNGKELTREFAIFGGDEVLAEFLRQAI